MLSSAPPPYLLADVEVLVVDCQTTGASPSYGSVLELGWCVAKASDPQLETAAQAHWIVPPPGEHISAQVRQLTGFEESVLSAALEPAQAWQQLRRLMPETSAMPAAIHFARFELSFLRDWSQRFEPSTAFPIEAVCVHAIACRLYPDLPRRNLRALAGFLGHGLHLERRSLGHVQATAFIWRKLVGTLAERGITTWPELASWLASPERPAAPRKRKYPLAPARYRSLPDEPGVYRFLRSNGDVLYVGKATSLKKRVSSHFTKQSGATERALEMLTQVSEVAFEPTSTALEAALLETQTIKLINPPYNVQLIQGERGVWFSSGDLATISPEPDAQHRFGPLSSRYSLRSLHALTQLLADKSLTPGRRAAAVGAPLRWAPDEQSFSEGWAQFLGRHVTNRALPSDPRQRALRVARCLRLSAEPEAEPELETDAAARPSVWDGPRVCRHLERAVAQNFQVLRRAAWLCLLASSAVCYREPGSSVNRYLVLAQAELIESGILADDTSPPAPSGRGERLAALGSFDAARYDSLRILTTELKRIQRDGGSVAVRLSATRTLTGTWLAGVLRLV
ncbi:MAG TPA: GIY-YIG nuclease family protein [Polyangiaceae bacterium]|nr:GIY-YIG nuclease family protein [Polyangiaceae bacterium]